jgi:phytoene dehydrogenase-like protein
MGAVTEAMAAAARAAGAVLRCSAPVRRIVVDGDRAVGVELADGEQIDAVTVLSSADPKRSFLELTGVAHLDAGFVRRIRNFRCHGLAAKLHLALDGLPRFTGLTPAELQARILLAPDLDYVERAFNPSKYRTFSPDPIFEITLPSVADPGLAPEGKHVLSAVVQYAPYDLEGGWEAGREAFLERLLTLLEAYAPGLRALVLHAELLSPVDIEARFGITGGHWHHGELSFDQLFMLRPVPGAAQYVTPLPGFYLCGAGSHPGGGVMGAAGMNAAARVLAKEFQP